MDWLTYTISEEIRGTLNQELHASYLNYIQNRHLFDFRLLDDLALHELFTLYNQLFLNNSLLNYGDNLSLYVAKRMTKSGGNTVFHKTRHTIRITINIPMIWQSFQQTDRKIIVNGLECTSAYEALYRVMEHELVHVIEFLVYGESNCNRKRFQTITRNLFGHTYHKHELVTNQEAAWLAMKLKPGDKVSFILQDALYTGILYRIHKRAIIMVEDAKGSFKDNDGKRYQKFYVPLSSLQ